VQTIIPLGSGNGALRLTTARYFTPSDLFLSRSKESAPAFPGRASETTRRDSASRT
jgi:hypothetical protein